MRRSPELGSELSTRTHAVAMADKDKKPAAAGKPEAETPEESQPQSSSAPAVIEAIVHPLVLLSVTGTY